MTTVAEDFWLILWLIVLVVFLITALAAVGEGPDIYG